SSPLVRVMHTWIFTGDGNRDRIRDMGWRFDAAGEVDRGRYLIDGDEPRWVEGDFLLQHRHNAWALVRNGRDAQTGDRAMGVMRMRTNGADVVLGIKDFWQNYPSELSIDNRGMTFHNWPRHGRPSTEPITPENAF